MQGLPDSSSWLLKQAVRSFNKERYRLTSWLCWIELILNPDDYFALCWYAKIAYTFRAIIMTIKLLRFMVEL